LEELRQDAENAFSGSDTNPQLLAVMKMHGMRSEDFMKVPEPIVSDLIPNKEKADRIKEQRKELFEKLQHDRLNTLSASMEKLDDGLRSDHEMVRRQAMHSIERYAKVGNGVNPVCDDDLPPVGALAGMGNFEEMQTQRYAAVKADQQRKANLLVTGFLQEKKRAEDADQRMAEMEERAAVMRKEKQAEIKLKKMEAAKKADVRKEGRRKKEEARLKWEDEEEERQKDRLTKARSTRAQTYSVDNMQEKFEKAQQKRETCFQQAADAEEALVNAITEKTRKMQERLEEDRLQKYDDMMRKQELSALKMQEKQVDLERKRQLWAEKKLADHTAFSDKTKLARDTGALELKRRSKSTGDLTKKAMDKWRGGQLREKNKQGTNNAAIMDRHSAATDRVEALKPLKLKCECDVFSAMEYKEGTWGTLNHRHQEQQQAQRDAYTQHTVYKIAEMNMKLEAKKQGFRELQKNRVEMGKQALAQADAAAEGFIRIKAEPDPEKVAMVLAGLGFDMPTLPKSAKEGEEGEEGKPAF